jgi:tellurite resistance protein
MKTRAIPLASFTSVMGIAGLGLAWRVASQVEHVPSGVGEVLLAVAATVFIVLLVAWIARSVTHSQELRTESNVAITASYFGTITISCSLLAAGAIPYSKLAATALWAVAAFGGAGLLIYLLGHWIERGIPAYELTPALFLPVVGNAAAVYAAVPLGYTDIAWASFSFAVLCWLTLGPIITFRLLVAEPRLPRKLAPQLGILVSSPAVMASAWYLLTLDGGPVFKVLMFKAVFFALLTIRLWKVAWGEPFNVAMWGYTFPAAALAAACERGNLVSPTSFSAVLATSTLTVATATVVLCTGQTAIGWIRQLRRLDSQPQKATA